MTRMKYRATNEPSFVVVDKLRLVHGETRTVGWDRLVQTVHNSVDYLLRVNKPINILQDPISVEKKTATLQQSWNLWHDISQKGTAQRYSVRMTTSFQNKPCKMITKTAKWIPNLFMHRNHGYSINVKLYPINYSLRVKYSMLLKYDVVAIAVRLL